MASTDGPRLRVREVTLRVRRAQMRIPFHFGDMRLTACPQVFARVRVELESGASAFGCAAELMVPRWFDKRATRTPADNVADLRAALEAATQAYLAHGRFDTPFTLFESHYAPLAALHAEAGRTGLSGAYGQAVLDRAVIDACCQATQTSFYRFAGGNGMGLRQSALAPDLQGFDWAGWLAQKTPLRAIDVRHTVGLHDALREEVVGEDGLPASLASAIRRYGLRYFKLKISGDVANDLARVQAVVAVLQELSPDYRFTLDGNEQYRSAQDLQELVAGLARMDLGQRLLYLEQPVARERSFESALPRTAFPFLLDEADDALSSFVQGQALGWTGVSAKGCKGIYKSFINAARCAVGQGAGKQLFMSAEDLSCQAGLAVQQDLSIAAFLGLTHAERNGHHFGRGLADMPAVERESFLHAHPELYASEPVPHLRIAGGAVQLSSFDGVGFGGPAPIALEASQPLSAATELL